MKILVVGKFYAEGFAQHIAETIVNMGHQVQCYQPGLSYKNSDNPLFQKFNKVRFALYDIYSRTNWYHEKGQKNIITAVESENIDLTIVCHDFLTPRQVDALRKKTKSPIVLWFPDHIGAFGKSMFLNSKYDLLFFKDPYIVHVLRNSLNKAAFYLPECCNPIYHKKIELTDSDLKKYSCEISTAGNLHPNRIALFEQLVDYNVKIWGNPAPLWAITSEIKHAIRNEFVANEEKSKSFIASKIVINNLQPAEVIGVNVRAFEISAAGAFQLINWRSGLSQLFDSDEIVSFKNLSELKDKIDYYLKNDSERLFIANKSWWRTHKDHTYQKRLQLMFDTIFNNQKAYPLKDNY